MNIDFIQKLKNRLDQPNRPAEKAHQMMESSARRAANSFQYKGREQTRIAAVMMLLYPDDTDSNNEFLLPLVLRPPYEGTHNHGGQIGLPGGGKEAQDESLMMTALRETEEEIGIKVPRKNILGSLSDLYIPPSDSLVTPFIGFLDKKPSFVPDPKEVDRIIEAELLNLKDPEFRLQKEIELPNKLVLDVPYFAVKQDTVWGATAMMLSEFIHLVDEIY